MILQDSLLIIIILAVLLISFILKKQKKSDPKWNAILIIPAMCSVIHILIFKNNVFMYTVYFGSAMLLILYVVRKKKITYGLVSMIVIILAIMPVVMVNITDSNCYASLQYVDAFKQLHKDMKNHYALQGWKETDFDSKYNSYIELFKEAQQKRINLHMSMHFNLI